MRLAYLLPLFLFCQKIKAQDTVKVQLQGTGEQQAEQLYNMGLEAMNKGENQTAVNLFSS